MITINYKILKSLIFLFLFLQAVPFLTRENMQPILIFDYSVVLSAIFIFTISKRDKKNPFKFFYLSALVIVSFLLYLYGFSGSISGYILAAAVPFFIFNHIDSPAKLMDILFVPIKWGAIIFSLFGAILFSQIYNKLNVYQLLPTFFIKASINYVSLLFSGTALIYLMLYEIKKKYATISRFDYFVAVLILLSSAFYSQMYSTRITFLASLLMLLIFFRKYKIKMFIIGAFAGVVFRMQLVNFFVGFFGSDSIGALASEDIRVNSINLFLFSVMDFNYDFTNTKSFSSLVNLLFCLFPFTLYFAYDLLYSTIHIIFIKSLKTKIFYMLLLIIAIFVSVYQMDFYSIFALFMCTQFIIFESKHNPEKNPNASKIRNSDKKIKWNFSH